jgi:hypothetical protein
MSRSTTKIIFQIVSKLAWIAIIFFGVVVLCQVLDPDWLLNPTTLNAPFQFDEPLTLVEMIAAYWPKEILITLSLYLLYEVFISEWLYVLIGKSGLPGSVLVPVLILSYILVVVGYILLSDITYPSRLSDAKLTPVLLMGSGSILLIPFLFAVNDHAAKPSSSVVFTTQLVLLFTPAYIALLVWHQYLRSGEIELIYVLKSLF